MLARRPKSPPAVAMCASIALGCDGGLSNGAVAKRLHLAAVTVCKWRERFRVNRLERLLDEPRPGAPRSVTDGHMEAVVTQTLESMPENGTQWSSRLMARKTALSQTAVVRTWHAFGLQRHRVENFKFSKDPQFVGKMRDIVGLYMNPPDHAIAIRVDEKSQVQALNRHGVTSLFAALNVAAGQAIGQCRTPRPPREPHQSSPVGEGEARVLGPTQPRAQTLRLDGGRRFHSRRGRKTL